MSADERSDFELLEAWREGDQRAGRELFARHFDAIYRFFRSKIEDAADDLTQQTFLGCVKHGEKDYHEQDHHRDELEDGCCFPRRTPEAPPR